MPDISVNRTTYIKIGTAQPITTGIAEGSMLIDRVLFVDDFKFGQFASSRFEIQIYGINNVAGQNIEVYQTENNVRTDLFVGQIESSKLDNAGYYRDIIAYDKFYFIAKKNVADWFNSLWTNNTQISVLDAFKSLLTYFDIDYDTNTVAAANFTGNLYKTSVPSFEKISFKDMVKFLLEPLALIPYINASGDVAVFSPSMANSVDLAGKYDKNQSVFEEYEVLPMQWVGIANIDSAILAQEEITGNTSDIRYDLPYNPIRLDLYVEDAETAQEAVLEDFIDKAPFDAYTPCEVLMIVSDMSIKLGDKITTTRGTSYVSEMILSGPMLVEQQLISRGSQVQQEVEEEYDPVFAYLDNKVTEATEDLQDQIDNFEPSEEYLEKVNEFSSTVATGMGLKTIKRIQDGATITYFYAPDANGAITNSKFVFVMKSNGFFWTNEWKGNADASSEGNTSWGQGIGANGSSLVKILNAYKISADYIEGGVLEIKDARGNVVHRFSNIDGSADIGGGYDNGGISYDVVNGTRVGSQVVIGAAQQAVEDVLSNQLVEYAVSESGTTPPSDGGSETNTFYITFDTNGSTSGVMSLLLLPASWEESQFGAQISDSVSKSLWDSTQKYLYRFERTDYSDGTYDIDNVQLIATFGSGSSSTVIAEDHLYGTLSDQSDISISLLNNATVWNSLKPNTSLYATALDWRSGVLLYSFTRTVYANGSFVASNLVTYPYGSGSSSTVLETQKWWYASISDSTSSASSINGAWNGNGKALHGIHYFETPWGEESSIAGVDYLYLHTLNRTVYANGSSDITNIKVEAIYGQSYPQFGDNPWSTTMPSIAENKGKYLWTRTTIGENEPTYAVNYIGTDGVDGQPGTPGSPGAAGNGVSDITQYYYATENTGDTLPDVGSSSWKTLPSNTNFSQSYPYLWSYTKTTYTQTSATTTTPSIVGVWGQDGDTEEGTQGRGIVSIVPQYVLSTSNSTSNRPGDSAGWSEDMPPYSDGTGGVRRYYWQRDKITYDKALNGSTISYTTPVLMQGVNSTMLAVNELNADFARVIVKENNQTYIDGAKIYTGSVTADAIAAYNALIKNLMANYVRVDGNVDVINGDVTITQAAANITESNMTSNFVDTFCQQRYGKSFSQLSPLIRPYAYMLAVAAYVATVAATAAGNGKLVVQTNDGTQKAALYPNLLLLTNSSNSEFSYYGNDAMIAGNVKVAGNLTAGNIQKGEKEFSISSYFADQSGEYSGSVSFENSFSYVPTVTASVLNENSTYHKVSFVLTSVSTTGFSFYVSVFDVKGYIDAYGSFPLKLHWNAMS